MKVGRVAIITRGRYAAGNLDEGSGSDFSMVDSERRGRRSGRIGGERSIRTGSRLDIEKDVLTRDLFAKSQVVIVQPNDTGSKAHPFPYAIVAGIERYPLKVTRRMGKKMVEKRSRIKPFIKVVNYNHLMPTRYTLELEGLKGAVSQETFKEVSTREDAKKNVKKALEDRYTSGKNRWFFTPLRF
ncbi:60S ribosomal protein L27-A [Aspergillus udagawae]|uniref:60S ribosomal protein L27 n=1 Tax=Aspergillus udagawae TaxID=91492 RepID=A0A8H3SCV6_9EURO|nr:60S ribosomal protein L27-A [Aspergillus udagawae]